MTTQSLRGMAKHGAMHWRGDRTGGNDAANVQPDSGAFDERAAFAKFSGAFVGLLGRTAEPTAAEMNAFASFALKLTYPPNPIRRLDNSLTPMQQAGRDFYFGAKSDSVGNCNSCHRLDQAAGLFGTDGLSANDGLPQLFKIAHLRNMYRKVGMFGVPTIANNLSVDNAHAGDQIRGFGYEFDGATDTLFRFLQGRVFSFPDATKQRTRAVHAGLRFQSGTGRRPANHRHSRRSR